MEFSSRQIEVVKLLARGVSTEDAAAELGLSPRTIKSHCDALRYKLGVKQRREIPSKFMQVTGESPFPTNGRAA